METTWLLNDQNILSLDHNSADYHVLKHNCTILRETQLDKLSPFTHFLENTQGSTGVGGWGWVG